jgi:hypothetical protein
MGEILEVYREAIERAKNRRKEVSPRSTQSSAGAGARTESLGKLKEEQLKVGPKGAQHRGRCKSSSARRAREWERASQIYTDGRQG